MVKINKKTMPAVFQNQCTKYEDKACIAFKKDGGYVDISWKDMNTMVRNIGLYLLSQGIKKGDKVAIFAENRFEWWVADLASLSINAIDVPVYATNSSEEAQYILENSDSKICFVSSEDHLGRVLKTKKKCPKLETIIIFDELPKKKKGVISFKEALQKGSEYKKPADFDKKLAAIKSDDVATYIYTSGTTGNPKGVMLTHDNFYSNVKQCNEYFNELITDEDTYLSFLPLSHSLERTIGFYHPIHQGSKVAFAESTVTLLEDFQLVRPTILISVPRIFEKVHGKVLSNIADASSIKKSIFNWAQKQARKNIPYNCQNKVKSGLFAKKYNLADKLVFSKLKETIGLNKLKFAISGGGPLPISDAEFFLGMGFKIYEGFGLTETTPVTNVNIPTLIKPGTVGLALKKTKVRISDEGEIQIKGPQVMKGYYKNAKATKEVFTKDGYFCTGDIGVIDEDGYLSITGRIKDIIVTAGGKNISPQNLENSLKASRYIEQIAIIGDKRKFLSALVVPAYEELEKWAKKNEIKYESFIDLNNNDMVNQLFRVDIDKYTRNFARVEQIRQFKLLAGEWSQETGELTPSLKVKRGVISDKYTKEIEGLYQE